MDSKRRRKRKPRRPEAKKWSCTLVLEASTAGGEGILGAPPGNPDKPPNLPPMHRLVLPLFVAIVGVATVHGFLVSPVLQSRKAGRKHGALTTASSSADSIHEVAGTRV